MVSAIMDGKKMLKVRNVSIWLVCCLVFLAFFVPRNLSVIKLGIIVVAILLYFSQKSIQVRTKLFHLTSTKFLCLYMMYSLWSTGHGFLRGNPEVYQLFRLNVIYFLMLFVWIQIVENRKGFVAVLKACCVSSIGIAAYTLLFFAQTVQIINLPFFLYLDHSSGAMIHSGYVHITNMNMSMMLFLFPVILFIYGTNEIKMDESLVRLNKVAIAISVVAMMLSGRRIVWIVLFGSLACYVLFKTEKTTSKRIWKIVIAFVGTGLTFILLSKIVGINIEGFVDRFREAFRDRDNYGRVNVRWTQLEALWKGFLRNPIFGSGAGIGVQEVVRSTENSASYELSYALILYNAGIVGFIPYVLSLFIVLRALWKNGKTDGVSKALFWGLAYGLLANATNPYFSSSFDFLLWVFVPLMYLNIIETEHNSLVDDCLYA